MAMALLKMQRANQCLSVGRRLVLDMDGKLRLCVHHFVDGDVGATVLQL